MVINFYNHSCFKVQSGDFIIAFDPPSKESGYKTPRFQTDLILISHNHKNHNGRDVLNLKEENERFIFDTPGEYEIKDILIRGVQSSGGEIINTIFMLDFEDIRLCHMGDFSEEKLRPEIKEAIGKIDILFFPVKSAARGAKDGASIANALEPSVIIPMHYDANDKKNKDLEDFLKEFSEDQIERIDKFTIKKKDLSEENLKVAVFNPNL